TFDQFAEYGIHRNSIAPAIREDTALGFAEVTQEGRAGNAEWRRPTLFRLTYRDTLDLKATNEWRKITESDAEMIGKGARQKRSSRGKFHSTLFDNSSIEKRTETWYGKRTTKAKNARKSHSTGTDTTSRLTLHLGELRSTAQQTPRAP